MSVVKTVSDVANTFLARREIVCDFVAKSGQLKKLEAIEIVQKELGLGDKVIIPIRLKNHVGKTTVTGTFYVYDDENLAKKHVNPSILARLEKARKALKEQEESKGTEESEEQGGDKS